MKLMATYETEVYVGETGYAVIKQVDSMGDEAMIILSKEQAKAVYAELKELCELDDWPNSGAFLVEVSE